MSFDENTEILSFQNSNIRKSKLLSEALKDLKWLLSLDLTDNQMKGYNSQKLEINGLKPKKNLRFSIILKKFRESTLFSKRQNDYTI